MRLIDADELKKEVESAFHGMLGITVTEAVHEIIDRQPTIDPESLRPRAHWVSDWMYVNGKQVCAKWCSSCGFKSWMKTDYCHHCGSFMENKNGENYVKK